MLKQGAVLILLAATVAACGSSKQGRVASVSGGECKIFERAEFQVLGQTDYDQRWIDGNTVAGIAGCGWAPPTVRPESLQQQPGARPVAIKRKPSLRKRIKARIWPSKAEPVVPVPPIPKAEPALVPSDIIVRPVDPVDDLLDVPASPVQPTRTPTKKPRWWK